MWSWQSISPGSTLMPGTSMISVSAGQSQEPPVETAAIGLSRIKIEAPSTGALPLPSITRPPLNTIMAHLRQHGMPGAPPGRLFVGMGDAQHSGIVEALRDDLERQRQPGSGKAGANRHRRGAG